MDTPERHPKPGYTSSHVIEFKSVNVASLGSESLARVSALLDKLKRQRATLAVVMLAAKKDVDRAVKLVKRLGWLRKRIAPIAHAARQEYSDDCGERLEALKELNDSLVLNVEFDISDEAKKRFLNVVNAFDRVRQSNRIWDVATSQSVDRARARSAASSALDMRPVSFDRGSDDIMATDFKPPLLINDNGADLLLYPAFLAAQVSGRFALLDIREVEITAQPVTFVVDDGRVPPDAQTIGNTWRYVNKNGQPDRRFSNNPAIPLARYSTIFFRGAGLNEAWMVSNAEAGTAFGQAIAEFKASLKIAEAEAEGIAPPSADEWPDLELPEAVPRPIRDWRTPILFGGCFAVLIAIAITAMETLAPDYLASIRPLGSSSAVPLTGEATVHPEPAAKAAPAPVLRGAVGSPKPLTAEGIAELQRLLRKVGFDPGPADGKAGARTHRALAEWAKRRGVDDARLDERTLDSLRRS